MSLLLAVLARGLALAAAGLLAMGLLRRASAATRAAVGAAALLALLALPLGLLYAPKREVSAERVPFAPVTLGRLVAPSSTSKAERVVTIEPSARPLPVAEIVVGVWALGAAALVVRLLFGWWVAVGWVRRSARVDRDHAHPTLPQGKGPSYEVRSSSEITTPCAVWAGRPAILLPESHADWSEERRAAVLAHEAAHVRRGDLAVVLLSRLALALHWPNPLAWPLAGSVRRATEDAADDAVLRAGLRPADYAGHLLDLAQGRRGPALALPMAQRPDVHRRILLVLNPHRARGSVSLATLALASTLLGGVLVPVACLVVGQAVRRPSSPFGGIEASHYVDVRKGLTLPGTPANGFVGRFADRSTTTVVQIAMRTPQGVRAWRPDGRPISDAERVRVPLLRDEAHNRTILVRYRANDQSPEGGMGSGPRQGGEPSSLVFGGGGSRPSAGSGEWESYSFIGVPKEDGDRASFTFGLANEPWRTYRLPNATWSYHDRLRPTTAVRHPAYGAKDADDLRNVVVAKSIAAPVLRGANGLYAKDAKGSLRRGRVPSTALTFLLPPMAKTYTARVAARLRKGGEAKPFWNDDVSQGDAWGYRYHFRQRPEEIASFDIRTRGYRNVEFHDARLKPQG